MDMKNAIPKTMHMEMVNTLIMIFFDFAVIFIAIFLAIGPTRYISNANAMTKAMQKCPMLCINVIVPNISLR